MSQFSGNEIVPGGHGVLPVSDETITALYELAGYELTSSFASRRLYSLALLNDLMGGEQALLDWAENYQNKRSLFENVDGELERIYRDQRPEALTLLRHAWFAQSLMRPLPEDVPFEEVVGYCECFVLRWTKNTAEVRVRESGDVHPDIDKKHSGIFSCASPVFNCDEVGLRTPFAYENGVDRSEHEVSFVYGQVIFRVNCANNDPRVIVNSLKFHMESRSFNCRDWSKPLDLDVMKVFMLDQLGWVARENNIPFIARTEAEVTLMRQNDVASMMRLVINPHFGKDAVHVPFRLLIAPVPVEWQYSIQARSAYLRMLAASGGDETLSTAVLRAELAINPNALSYIWEFDNGDRIDETRDTGYDDFNLLIKWGPVPKYYADVPYGALIYLRVHSYADCRDYAYENLEFLFTTRPEELEYLSGLNWVEFEGMFGEDQFQFDREEFLKTYH